jgi:large subunit ribosomal protein L28
VRDARPEWWEFKNWITRNNKNKIEMSKICEITGKKAMVGNNVSKSKRHTKRKFDVNLFAKKFYWVEQDCWITLKVSAAGLRTINRIGLDAAIKRAAEKGYING